ncbi:MAG: DUF262 domain-containing protein [Kluyvera sp.]|uniref:DUF262 domain-containing protein n=1 Tax=Kluyvera sp. TaxID=1538228 RepID=UPI003A84AA92
MSDVLSEFSIKSLLSDSHSYVVPMYQRNYAWGESEINQLVQDIVDYQDKKNSRYYIGTLVVFKRKDGGLEVIDGQQRFTTLTLLALYLRNLALAEQKLPQMTWYQRINMNFESRPRSTNTFAALSQRLPLHLINGAEYNESLVRGYILLEKALSQLKPRTLKKFSDYIFNNVYIMRVEVPKDTDLNHYFEAMNNRGEQLEKHEVLKAKLMSVLNNIEDKDDRIEHIKVLQKVWAACENMERYVQYGFSVDERHRLFGKNDWGKFIPEDFDDILQCLDEHEHDGQVISLKDILSQPIHTHGEDNDSNDESPDRFNSVINFSNFLLHVLRVHTQSDISLDDKKLLEQFDEELLANDDPVEEVEGFVFALLNCKFLFDQYIIKREFLQGKDNWSIKRLKWYSRNSISFINSFDEHEGGYEGITREILMLQAAFHVSTPTLVYKHWLNAALYYLYYEENIDPKAYLTYLLNVARRFIFERYLSIDEGHSFFHMIYEEEDAYYPRNVKLDDIASTRLMFNNIESNFVFNFLDYLLWQERKHSDAIVNEFEFTFRSSVEHFYPQHPMNGEPTMDEASLHSFGNLCLISHSKNSRLSNLPPGAKLAYFSSARKNRTIDSLKLYEMLKIIERKGDWRESEIEQHGQEMLSLLLKSTIKRKK